MDAFSEIISLIGANLIKGMFMSVLVIIFCRKIFKKKLDTRNAISIIRWIMICYAVLILVDFLVLTLLAAGSGVFFSSFGERAIGRYAFAFWIIELGSISPLTLFFKKLGNNLYLILVLTILMNVGWLMESLVIHISSIQREYSPNVEGFKPIFHPKGELLIILQGTIFGVLSIVIGNLPFLKNTVE